MVQWRLLYLIFVKLDGLGALLVGPLRRLATEHARVAWRVRASPGHAALSTRMPGIRWDA